MLCIYKFTRMSGHISLFFQALSEGYFGAFCLSFGPWTHFQRPSYPVEGPFGILEINKKVSRHIKIFLAILRYLDISYGTIIALVIDTTSRTAQKNYIRLGLH